MKENLKVACIGAGSSGTGHLILLERFVPGCAVAFSDVSRSMFDQIVKGYLGDGGQDAAGDFKTEAGGLRPSFRDLPYYEDPEEMFAKEDFNTVVIATYCSHHAEMVEKCVKHKKNILLEKPIAITEEDVERTWRLLRNYPKVATVNFTIRGAPVFLAAVHHRQRGTIGKMVSMQWINNVHYGDGYFRHWMRTQKNVGNLFLQKATHDLDCMNVISGLTPVRVAAFGSRRVYGGDMPNDLTCDVCRRKWTCPMSLYKLGLDAGKPMYPKHLRKCVYAKEIDIDDNQVVIVEYEGGVTASYSQTFNAPQQGGERGGNFIGTEGIMKLKLYGEFDETPAGQILKGTSHLDITRYHQKPGSRIHEVYDWNGHGHFDGTEYVMLAKLDVLNGRKNEAAGTMWQGYVSAKMCLAAQESIETGKVVTLRLSK